MGQFGLSRRAGCHLTNLDNRGLGFLISFSNVHLQLQFSSFPPSTFFFLLALFFFTLPSLPCLLGRYMHSRLVHNLHI